MSFKAQTCIVIFCDGGYLDPWDPDDGTPHFDNEAEAVEYATGCGWLVTDMRALCGRCHAKVTCEATGHEWGIWHDYSRDGITCRRRGCDRCDIDEYDPPFEELYPKFQALRDAEEILNEAGRAGDVR